MSADLLCQGQLQRLKDHKYNAQGTSILEPFFQPYWRFVVELMPLWLAPNLITILGLFCNVASSLLLVYFSPRASDSIPAYPEIICLIGLFIYQTLDAIDGKQARRTGSCSPLGELFDHGCDAISTVAVSLAITCSLGLGNYPNFLFYFFINNVFIYYLAHWQTYISGVLVFGTVDVTEAQVFGMIIFLLSAIYGQSLWAYEVPQLWNMSICQFVVLSSGMFSFYYMLGTFSKILAGGVGKNKSSIAGTSVLSPAVPIGIVLACVFYVFKHSHSNIFQEEPCIAILMYGIAIAKLSCKLVVATMTKHPVDMLDSCMLGPAVLSFINYFSIPLDEKLVLYGALVFETLNLLIFCTQICREISTSFGIYIFSIGKKEDEQKKIE
eukprot:gene12172-13428_t